MLVAVICLKERVEQRLCMKLMQMLHEVLDFRILLMLLLIELLDVRATRAGLQRAQSHNLTAINLRQLLQNTMLIELDNEVLVSRVRHITIHVELVVRQVCLVDET